MKIIRKPKTQEQLVKLAVSLSALGDEDLMTLAETLDRTDALTAQALAHALTDARDERIRNQRSDERLIVGH